MDRNGTGKVADFGLAMLAQPNCDSLLVEHVSGTAGYADPHYIRTGKVSTASEVYSFGMVLLELLTRRPPALQHTSGCIAYQFLHLNGELAKVREMVDPSCSWPAEMVDNIGDMALSCISEQESSRPTFVDIVAHLRKITREDGMPSAPSAASSQSRAPLPSFSRNSNGIGSASPNVVAASDRAVLAAGDRADFAAGVRPVLAAAGRATASQAVGSSLGSRVIATKVETMQLRAENGAGAQPRSPLTANTRMVDSEVDVPVHKPKALAPGSMARMPVSQHRPLGNPGAASAAGMLGSLDSGPVVVDCGVARHPLRSRAGEAASAARTTQGSSAALMFGGSTTAAPVASFGPLPEENPEEWIDPRQHMAQLNAQPTLTGSEADVWIDPRPGPPELEVNAQQPAQQPAQVGFQGEASEREATMRRLQQELGFSEQQVIEAFKRCSTAEAAVDWILSSDWG